MFDRRRVRWVALCAGAEAIGIAAAASAGWSAQRLPQDTSSGAALALVVAGGLVEGTALGVLQAAGLAPVVPGLDRRRWILVTVLVAGLGWAAASAPATLSTDDGGPGPALVLVLAGAAGLGAAMGAVLGGAQSLVLRHRVAHPGRWPGANALAWTAAMPVIFLGANVTGADWPIWSVALLGAVTGAAAGAVLGLITALFLPGLDPDRSRSEAG
jgi:hypothetical protein